MSEEELQQAIASIVDTKLRSILQSHVNSNKAAIQILLDQIGALVTKVNALTPGPGL